MRSEVGATCVMSKWLYRLIVASAAIVFAATFVWTGARLRRRGVVLGNEGHSERVPGRMHLIPGLTTPTTGCLIDVAPLYTIVRFAANGW